MDLLKNEALSDFQIVVEDHVYKLHKLILYRCEYFASLLTSSTSESLNNSVSLPYNKFTFDSFLYYLYTNSDLSEWDAKKSELLEVAIYLQYTILIDQFQKWINNCQSNVLGELFPMLLAYYPEFLHKIEYKL